MEALGLDAGLAVNPDTPFEDYEADETVDHFTAVGGMTARADKIPEEHGNREQGETCNQHAGEGTSAEG